LPGRPKSPVRAPPRAPFGDSPAALTRLAGLRDGFAAASASSFAGADSAPASFSAGADSASAASSAAADSGPAAAILAAHAHRLAGQKPVLTHFDFWSGNVLLEHGVITGVVDWSGAAQAPRGLDVSWCRLDLTAAKLRERHTNWTQECLDHFQRRSR